MLAWRGTLFCLASTTSRSEISEIQALSLQGLAELLSFAASLQRLPLHLG